MFFFASPVHFYFHSLADMFARLKLEWTLLSMKIFCDVDVMAVMHVNSTSWFCEFVCERERGLAICSRSEGK